MAMKEDVRWSKETDSLLLDRIDYFLSEAGMKRAALGRALGWHISTVGRFFNAERRLLAQDIIAIAGALNIEPNQLLDIGKQLESPQKWIQPHRDCDGAVVAPTGVDPVTSRFSVVRSTN